MSMFDKHGSTTRRDLLRTLGAAAAAPFSALAFKQGRCRDGYATRNCPLSEELATAPIQPLFAPTGWKTVALDHIGFQLPDYQKEAAFYIALLGWKLRSDDGKQAVLDIGDWGSAVFRQASGPAAVDHFCFVIESWNARKVETELQKRGLTPVAENNGNGFESFHVKDPDGFDLQISNGKGLAKARKRPPIAKPTASAPFEPTGWRTVWLDHLSYNASDFKKSVSFYSNLLGWRPTYDEGSQNELMIGEVGDAIVRGGNRSDPNFGKPGTQRARRERIDHISYGISPWDTDAVKAELEKRGLRARIDTSTHDDIHVAAFKSYHTTTPNGLDLQISYVTHENRLALSNAVKPKVLQGR
jgi:catechol 2,3-dioxygenase-like lactoylglutathione lyase family enzyme